MWRVIVVLIVMGLLSGCGDSRREAQSMGHYGVGYSDAHRICVDGYEFLWITGDRKGGLAQFWEIAPNGQPLPRVCGGNHAE